MAEDLGARQCTPCRGGIDPMAPEEAAALTARLPGWTLESNGLAIKRGFRFADFKSAMVFVTALAEVAEAQGHHPDVCLGWGWATVLWQTKKIMGLHENDFIMAGKTDQLAATMAQP